MSIKLQEDHQLIEISPNFKIAHQRVAYQNYEQLEKQIEASVFSFTPYFRSIRNLKRKFEWLNIRALLSELGVKNDIEYDEHGKPHLLNGDSHLSISHSHEHIAVSFHQSSPHGIDLQLINPKIIRIREKFLRDVELEQIDQKNVTTLTLLWSMKEALFKLYGKKDIFLKQNILLSELSEQDGEFTALGKIQGIENEIEVPMRAGLMKNYVLAYTLIP